MTVTENNISVSFILPFILILGLLTSSLSATINVNQDNVATSNSIASKIALKILQQGGNAVDAGVAAMFALTVVEPYSSGLGGGGLMLIKMNQSAKATFIDFREQAPINIDPSIFYQSEDDFEFYSRSGIFSVCVPGMVAGAEKALKLYGTRSFEEILTPVIKLAEEGFPVNESLSKIFIKYYDHIESNRITSSIFFPDWIPLETGETLFRKDLAQSLRLISSDGASAFYHGKIAENFVRSIEINDGLIRMPDLVAYQARLTPALQIDYKEFQIISCPLPSIYGGALLELLSILENFNLTDLNPNSGQFIHFFVEALKQVYETGLWEIYKYSGNPQTWFDNILQENFILKMVNQIDSTQSRKISQVPINSLESRNAAQISIIDKSGNAIAINQSLNNFFGSAITTETYGVLLNNSMNTFSHDSSSVNAIKPGIRPFTRLAPTILLKEGKPFLAICCSGSDRIVSTLGQIIIYLIDFNMSLEEAVKMPRFHYDFREDIIEMETRIEADAIDYLKSSGHRIKLFTDFDIHFGNVQVVRFDSFKNQATSFSDVRKEGVIYIE